MYSPLICPRKRRARTVASSASCDASASFEAIPRSRSTTARPAKDRGPFLMAANDERVLRSDGARLVRIEFSAGSTIGDVRRYALRNKSARSKNTIRMTEP